MKKVLIMISILLCMVSAFAGTYLSDLTNLLSVYGYVNEYCVISINPIVSYESVNEGLPFNIKGDDVAYGSTGRRVATWSMATNSTAVNLSILAEPLYLSSDITKLLNFYLYMNYSYEGTDEQTGNTIINSGIITVHSGGEATAFSLPLSVEAGGEPIISRNQSILFAFDSETTARIPTDAVPSGMYYGNVIITMEAL